MVQGSPKTLRIAKTAAAAVAVAAAVARKKEQRLPCPKGQSRPIMFLPNRTTAVDDLRIYSGHVSQI